MMTYIWRQCQRPSCRFRFPVTNERQPGTICPLCQSPTVVMATIPGGSEMQAPRPNEGTAVAALLDNLRSVYNVGSIFRTADGAGVAHLHLAGITPPPTHPKIAKTALGAEEHIPWTQHKNGVETAVQLQQSGWQIWALEEGETAVSLFDYTPPTQPVLIVVGNEIAGVDPGILAVADKLVSLPMQGWKRSLNVATAFGIAAYFLRFQIRGRK